MCAWWSSAAEGKTCCCNNLTTSSWRNWWVHKGKGGISCTLTVCVRLWGISWTRAGWHRTVTSPNKSQCGEQKTFYGWRLSKNGNTASVFSAASVLNSLAYLWFCSENVTQCREQRLALVMGFNRKCGVTSETRAGRRAGGGVGEWSTKGAATAAGCR